MMVYLAAEDRIISMNFVRGSSPGTKKFIGPIHSMAEEVLVGEASLESPPTAWMMAPSIAT